MKYNGTYLIPDNIKMYLLATHEPKKWKKSSCKKVTKEQQPGLNDSGIK